MLVYFMPIIGHLVYKLRSFGVFFRVGMLYQEKSGNPAITCSLSLSRLGAWPLVCIAKVVSQKKLNLKFC
jgi:hypothetical protein